MEAKYNAVLKKDGKVIFLGDKPVVDSHHSDLSVPGLTPGNEAAPSADTFGESGDIFHHVLWRHVLAVLWVFNESRPFLLGLISMFCMRGKNVRNLWKGTCQTFNIPLPKIDDQERAKYSLVLGTGLTYPLIINFPRESSKVPGAALTMERFKCVMRVYSVPEMISARRLSAICAASGYEDLFRSYLIYSEETREATAEKQEETEEGKFWNSLLNQIDDEEILARINSRSIASGSVSTKEVYMEDESAIPGTVWWTGVNAMMTDAYNRICARVASVDKKTRLENSAFYSDFKKKVSARGITETSDPKYIKFLTSISTAMSKYIRRGTLMSQEENGILDSILASATSSGIVGGAKTEETKPNITVTGSTVVKMRESLTKSVGNMAVSVGTTSGSKIPPPPPGLPKTV